MTKTQAPELARIIDLLKNRQRFVISSHARPDGDSIGSQLALAYALRGLGKEVRVVNRDQAPPAILGFQGVADIVVSDRVDGEFDAAVIMECSDLPRTGVQGFERHLVVNIDHHPGNTGYGQINWIDESAAACAEMVFDVVRGLGAPLSVDIATHIYLGILTDTGSFHYSGLSPRTFDVCRQTLEAGINPTLIARQVYDTSSLGRLRLFGAVLQAMQMGAAGRAAVLYLDHAMAHAAGGEYEDTDGLINLPLTVKEIQTVVFFKRGDSNEYRVSMRTKGNVDIAAIAKEFGGGGHKNAAGCTVTGELHALQTTFLAKLDRAMTLADTPGPQL